MSEENDAPEKKEPIFIPKGDGLGWTLNFNNPKSYWVLAVILLTPFVVTAIAIYLKK